MALAPLPSVSVEPGERLKDPILEARARDISKGLRCLVCQNQSIADSNADLASDLRRTVFEMIEAGRSDDEIVEFMVERYGEFVMYRPPLNAATVALWTGPMLLGIAGIAALIVLLRRRNATAAPSAEALEARAASILARHETSPD